MTKSLLNRNVVLWMVVTLQLMTSVFMMTSAGSNLRMDMEMRKDDKYTWAVKYINQTLQNDTKFRHHAYESTAYLVDTYGPRLMGSQNLEDALVYLKELIFSNGFVNVKLEKFNYTKKWTRGEEHLTLLAPRKRPQRIPMVGLGKSVGGNVTAEVVVINSFEEFDSPSALQRIYSKIVVLNPKWTNYSSTVEYRNKGPSLAAKFGARGVLVRSIAPKSIENPHAGILDYDERYAKIPAASISIESADMLDRMVKRGQRVVVNLYMEAKNEEGVFQSHNLVGELRGSKHPEEIILVGGHLDSWDVGPQTGTIDDAAGVMVCFEAVRLLINKGLTPLRTVRFVAWVGEEFGDQDSKGSLHYAKQHQSEMDNHIVAFESDLGTTDIFGFGYSGGAKGYNLVKMVSELFFREIGSNTLSRTGVMSDTSPMFTNHKVPAMKNLVTDTPDNEFYFTYDHSAGDTVNVLNPDDMDRNVASIASMFYILADVPWRLPRD